MADIATIWDAENSLGDWHVAASTFGFAKDDLGNPILGADGRAVAVTPAGDAPGAGLASDRDLETAVLISLFTDAVATPDDLAAASTADPRGWWGDASIGSKLWLRMRAKRTSRTAALVRADVIAALAWLIDDGVAAAVDVSTQWISAGLMGCRITVRRADGRTVALAYQWAWKEL